MKKTVAIQLWDKIRELESVFSDPSREFNTCGESFKCINVVPLSESVALVTLEKDSGKHSHALFFYVKNYWIYFFPTDSHEMGMFNYLANGYRVCLEDFNFDKNFDIRLEKMNVEKIKGF